jgi:hypothetical protein
MTQKYLLCSNDRLGHPGKIMMRRIIESANGHPLKDLKILLSKDLSCATCSLGKLIIRPSKNKIENESPFFYREFKEIFVGLFLLYVDHLDILWF